jgi:hypothetical protein
MEAWSYMELSDSDLKLRFLLLIWLFKWQLGAMDISDSDLWLNYYQRQKQKWQHLSLNMYVCYWSLLLLKFVEFAVAHAGCRSDKQD